MTKGYVRAIAGVVAGVIQGAVMTLAFGAQPIGVVVGAIFGVSLSRVAKWTDGLAYGAIIGGAVGVTNGLISAYSGSRLAHVMVRASMGAVIGAVCGAAVARVFKGDQERFPE